MNLSKRLEILEILSKHYEGARIELFYETPFQLLIAVLLSAQATDIGVNKATKLLFEKIEGPQDIIDIGKDQLVEYIKSIGLYNTKANNIMALSDILIQKYQGQVPKSRQSLVKLPGVGRKTANVVLNELYGRPTIAVDTHIFRVCNRSGFAKGKTPLDVELRLIRYVPIAYKYNLHQWLIQLGRYTCVAKKPKCQSCVIQSLCEYADKT